MRYNSKLRKRRENGFTSLLRLAGALLVSLLLPLAASAYTVILRDGRSVQIPDTFSVTRAGITYEYAAGLYVTIQMTSIDVAATERANREAAGALLSRVGKQSRANTQSPRTADGARRTLTDKELEGARLRREASEAAYDKRRRELGLPSLEETRQKREEELRRYNVMAAQAEAEENQAESYWRARAEELRTAIAVNEAESSYLDSKIRTTLSAIDLPHLYTLGTPFPYIVQYPNGYYTPTVNPFPQAGLLIPPPRDFTRREPLPGRTTGGPGGAGPMRGRPSFPRGPYTGFPRRRPIGRPGNSVLPLPVYTPLAYGYNNYDDQSALRARMDELRTERVRLQTRWNLLGEEARRAGVPPGWLRP